jgi:copper ion binding protein
MTAIATTPIQSFPIEGMTCASCVRRVEKAIAAVPGVESASVNLATERADVRLAEPASPEAVVEAIRSAGYEVAAQTVDIGVDGMTCASCVGRVEKAVAAVPGVVSASVNLATERATVKVMWAERPFRPSRPQSAGRAMSRTGAKVRWQRMPSRPPGPENIAG